MNANNIQISPSSGSSLASAGAATRKSALGKFQHLGREMILLSSNPGLFGTGAAAAWPALDGNYLGQIKALFRHRGNEPEALGGGMSGKC